MKIFNISTISKKLIIVVLLSILFILPIRLINNLICDRQDYQKEAISSVVDPIGDETILEGIFIAIPYIEHIEKANENGNFIKEKISNYIMFSPKKYNLNIDVNTYNLSRGIFKVPIFDAKMNVNLLFDELDYKKHNIDEKNINIDNALLIICVDNKKCISMLPKLKINNNDVDVIEDTYNFIDSFSNKLCYSLKNVNLNEKIIINGEINFRGANSISIKPIADDNIINVISNWKSPGFSGGFLPMKREINNNGFVAFWEILGINTNYQKSWIYNGNYYQEPIKINFIKSIDNYVLTARCIKYAFLFLFIPFFTIFILEIITKKKVHPIQYIFIGAINIIFYLLLIAISEYIDFNFSYLICFLLVIIIMYIYISSIFKMKKYSNIICCVQLLIYIFLYLTLKSEDYALLIGSIGLFIVITLFMLVTRKIDWYGKE